MKLHIISIKKKIKMLHVEVLNKEGNWIEMYYNYHEFCFMMYHFFNKEYMQCPYFLERHICEWFAKNYVDKTMISDF